MDALTAGLFVAASFTSGLISNRSQYRLEAANINAQLSQAKLQSAESAYERTKQFRETMSSNLALSGIGIGGVGGLKGVNAQNISDYFADISAIGTQDLFNSITGQAQIAGAKGKRFRNNVSTAMDAATLASQLGLFGKKGK